MGDIVIPTEKTVIALQNKRDVAGTMPWFVERAKYPPRGGTVVHPLINGERAFAAVQDAIEAATHSIDIVSWGFDPSMRLRRPDGKRIGQILREKAAAGVAVRVLIWRNVVADLFGENNLPGAGLAGSGGGSVGAGSGVGSTAPGAAKPTGEKFNGYGAARGSGSGAVQYEDDEAKAFNRDWFARPGDGVSFRTRDFSDREARELASRHASRHGMLSRIRQRLAMGMFASHHQKTVLVDYEQPDRAVGFVMGHNFLRNYWDTDAHEYYSPERLFFAPWQDLSTRVYGPVLHDLNENFCTAWTKAQPMLGSDQPISGARLAIHPAAYEQPARRHGGSEVAQITRTQVSEGETSIHESYMLALASAREYVYFENQYFRFVDIAMHMRRNRRKLKAGGWKRDFYVFAVTNKPDDHGRLNTHTMLSALGKGAAMPAIEKKYGMDGPKEERAMRKSDLDGLNVVVCTLCAYGTEVPEPQVTDTGLVDAMGFPQISVSQPMPRIVYADVYVHSKLMLIDDVFFTIGSANVNERSMLNDTELNIAVTSPRITREWREKLWRMHTKRAPEQATKDEFADWVQIAADGLQARKDGEPLAAPLIEFYDDSTTGKRDD
jgi:phosphatidylserine/phosphatidylglycerophosphate/cardiolipin synthase-like enzyme